MKKCPIIVTGAAGFIGFHLSKHLLEKGIPIIGIDNVNNYYDVQLKHARLEQLQQFPHFLFEKVDIADREILFSIFEANHTKTIIHLAAQAGVRYSIDHPFAYVDTNLVGFSNILEACRHYQVEHLIYASSSSVYGANTKLPFQTSDPVNHPISLYGATKRANELMAYTYSHLYQIPTTGLRFFTVYGPWGRPDMAYYSFTKKIMEGKKVQLFNYGDMRRDFTYVDDIVEGIVRLINHPPVSNKLDTNIASTQISKQAPYKIYNIGNNKPVHLHEFIQTLEKLIGIKASIEYLPMQPGDVKETYADITDLQQDINFSPQTSIHNGLVKFVEWYKYWHERDMG